MKVLHISHNLRGGAGKNLLRHHLALLDSGVESRILIGETHEATEHVQSLGAYQWPDVDFQELGESIGRTLEPLIGDSVFLNRRMKALEGHPWVQWADVVEFRQVHAGGHRPYLALEAIGEVAAQRTVVWRLSDMWALTGFCAYSYECEAWKSGCGRCPQLSDAGRFRAELKTPRWDSSRFQWKRKRQAYGSAPLTIVSPSRWMDGIVADSFFGEQNRRVIPIGVEEAVYRRDRAKCRLQLGLEEDAIALLAILPNPNNHRKGYDLAMQVVSRLKDDLGKVVLVVVSSKPVDQGACALPMIEAGFRSSDESMAEVYAACDILLFSSRVDNSSQVLVEAGMSGLAVAAFDVGGNSEYLSEASRKRMSPAENVESMVRAIEEMALDKTVLERIQKETRLEIRERFCLDRQTDAFKTLYCELKDESASYRL